MCLLIYVSIKVYFICVCEKVKIEKNFFQTCPKDIDMCTSFFEERNPAIFYPGLENGRMPPPIILKLFKPSQLP